ncbi:hypothetical protein G7Y89_g13095 [Cudoniella acicularis]|uniref:Uncharacterized protein n=1 Tax=Cudoniella acicularis TaxID=354080 RepID=A0A8H4RA96_9HELO|nr:hypothetical protein G7Y89_g13095 [Cudoniella acicularis]
MMSTVEDATNRRDDPDVGSQLQSRDQSELLDTIDELTRRGLRNYVSLPQIIVCGDQSSGKSSVLEAISHIRFPTKENLCTTFATELLLRRNPSSSAPVCIIPGSSRSGKPQAREELERFPVGVAYDNPEDIPRLIEAAKQAMKEASGTTSNPFFDDKLRIQLCKPEWPPITIVDLPGLIHTENQDQTQNDVQTVRNLVKGYMDDPRSIILAIVSAQSDTALQIVLSLAKAADPDRVRTMGIITKPDTLIQRGPESMNDFRKLALNESEIHQFKLGWHVLKNRDPRSMKQTAAERDADEKSFFSQPPWMNFEDQNCLGIDSLRLRLSRVLHERIASSLPDIIDEIRGEIVKSETELTKLGKERSSRQAKEVYLIGIAQRFQTLAQSAVDGTWNDQFDPFFKNPYSSEGYDKRLRAVIQNLNDQFAELMALKGHRWQIIKVGDDDEDSDEEASYKDSDDEDDNLEGTSNSRETAKDSEQPPPKYPGSDKFEDCKRISRHDFIKKIEILSRATRGRELSGVFNHHTIGELFREQSVKWAKLAEHHVETVWAAVKLFLEEAFATLADARSLNAILLDVVDPMMNQRNEHAKQKLTEILVPHTRLHPISYNNKLVQSMKEAKYKRELKRIRHEATSLIILLKEKKKSEHSLQKLIDASDRSIQPELGEKFGCEDILNYMNAYYEISMNTFVDNVATLVVESCLVTDLADIFPAVKIPQMDDYTLDRLASDSEEVQVKRKKLEIKLAYLRRLNLASSKPKSNPAIQEQPSSTTTTLPPPPESVLVQRPSSSSKTLPTRQQQPASSSKSSTPSKPNPKNNKESTPTAPVSTSNLFSTPPPPQNSSTFLTPKAESETRYDAAVITYFTKGAKKFASATGNNQKSPEESGTSAPAAVLKTSAATISSPSTAHTTGGIFGGLNAAARSTPASTTKTVGIFGGLKTSTSSVAATPQSTSPLGAATTSSSTQSEHKPFGGSLSGGFGGFGAPPASPSTTERTLFPQTAFGATTTQSNVFGGSLFGSSSSTTKHTPSSQPVLRRNKAVKYIWRRKPREEISEYFLL